jgi:hypothetical protein
MIIQLVEEEKQKIAERVKRFGATIEESEEETKKKRMERFGPTNEDEVIP